MRRVVLLVLRTAADGRVDHTDRASDEKKLQEGSGGQGSAADVRL